MCKNHDSLHYPERLRKAALVLCCGDEIERDVMLRYATLQGLLQVVEDSLPSMPVQVALPGINELKRFNREWASEFARASVKVHELWDAEASRFVNLDEIPY